MRTLKQYVVPPVRKLLLAIVFAAVPANLSEASEDRLTVFLAGDTIVMREFADVLEPSFVALVDTMRSADVAVVNLETLLHTFEGFPQADSGGTWMATPPAVAHDLRWAGIDMVSTANNHTFDYGGIGVRENLEAIAAAGLVSAGSGMDLAAARAAASFDTPKGRVSLVSGSASFESYWAAGPATAGLHGRPGLNPLNSIRDGWSIPGWFGDSLGWVARQVGYGGQRFAEPEFDLFGQTFVRSTGFGRFDGVAAADRQAFLAEVRATRESAVTIAAIHAHRQGPWLEGFARDVIDAGADIVIAHGPHEVRAIEIYRNRPIFYSLGDFFFEQYHIEHLPAEYYTKQGVSPTAAPAQAVTKFFEDRDWIDRPAKWRGLAAIVTIAANEVDEIRLLPTDLGVDRPLPERGRPHVAAPPRAEAIIADAASSSADYGTTIVYDPATGSGLVELEGGARTAALQGTAAEVMSPVRLHRADVRTGPVPSPPESSHETGRADSSEACRSGSSCRSSQANLVSHPRPEIFSDRNKEHRSW